MFTRATLPGNSSWARGAAPSRRSRLRDPSREATKTDRRTAEPEAGSRLTSQRLARPTDAARRPGKWRPRPPPKPPKTRPAERRRGNAGVTEEQADE